MHTLIISDIHLGSSVSRTKELLKLLNTETYKTLILNGDIFDDLDFTRLDHDAWQVLSKIRDLSSPKHGIDVVWITGNHDGGANILSRLIGTPVKDEYLFEWNGKRCLAIHGHQFDQFITHNPILSSIASQTYLFIQRLDTERQFISRYLKRISKSWLRVSERVAQGAVRRGKLMGADIVFCGHTHKAMEKEIQGIQYYNSGCWTDIPSTYILIGDSEIILKEV
ncbi:MAG: UDP-2,3-diacylglucosamine diphosphatase [Candidatus Paceibacterota bacterium]|jgi:UDP-2,3-diacylglucosamine pyrophosphatase LpxH